VSFAINSSKLQFFYIYICSFITLLLLLHGTVYVFQNLLADQISSTSHHQRRRYDVLSILKMAAAAVQYYFWFHI